jgi:hypothetical protein
MTCTECGEPVEDQRRTLCPDCWAERHIRRGGRNSHPVPAPIGTPDPSWLHRDARRLLNRDDNLVIRYLADENRAAYLNAWAVFLLGWAPKFKEVDEELLDRLRDLVREADEEAES